MGGDAGLREEIESLKRQNAELLRVNEELERFACMASHDLAEPLRIITTYARLLSKTSDILDPDSAFFLKNIGDAVGHMRDLLSDLSAYTGLAGYPPTPLVAVELDAVVDVVKQNLRASLEESNAMVTVDGLPRVHGHLSDFISLFQNLVGNAIKYRSSCPPEIQISALKVDGEQHFCVADNGIGIDEKYHEEIFSPFKRLHGRSVPGTGLGLAICKRVVERYKGRIWVDSRAGDGASFRFTLPAGTE